MWFSYIMGFVSIAILVGSMIIVITKQAKTSSIAVYFFIISIICILFWIIANLVNVYLGQKGLESQALIWSMISTVSSSIGMLTIIFFVRMLMSKEEYNSIYVSIAFLLFGGVLGTTFSSNYSVELIYVEFGNYYFYIAKSNLLWIVFVSGLAIFAGTLFLIYLIRQKKFVAIGNKNVLNLMIIGTIIAYYGSAVIFTIRKIVYETVGGVVMVHMEWIAVSIGSFIMGLSIYLGGIEAFYYSSEIYAIYIFDKYGTVTYSASFRKRLKLKGHIILGVTTAFSEFATDLMGKEVYPKEIDFGIYSLLIEKKNEHICLVSCKYPTAFLRQGVKRILTDFTPSMTIEEKSVLIKKYLAFKPLSYKI